jgi:hypothetical protein
MGSMPYFVQPFYYGNAYMLLAMGTYGGGGVPMCCFCHRRPIGGAAHVPMRLYATFSHNGSEWYVNLLLIGSTTNWHQPDVCLSIVFHHTLFGGGGCWGLVVLTYIPHLGTLSLGYFSCPWVRGMCACWYVCLRGPSLERSPWPSASVCLLNGWVRGG